jgi:hypothetical protein
MRALIAAAVAALTLVTFGANGAGAKDGDVIETGACSATSNWKLKLSDEDGGIETEFEVDTNIAGQTWKAKLKHNGVPAARSVKATKPPSGSFELRRVLPNAAGSDVVVGKARNPSTGETCHGQATFPG